MDDPPNKEQRLRNRRQKSRLLEKGIESLNKPVINPVQNINKNMNR